MNKKELETVTRLEVISESGRILTLHDIKIEKVSFQDDNRTLKIFVKINGEWSNG